MKNIKSTAFVLQRTNYGESDRIIHVLTPEHGKISLIAKGVRKQKSKLAPAIELFSLSTIVVHFGQSELGILTSAKLEIFYENILKNYDRLQFGYEVIKYIKHLSEHVREERLFDFVRVALESLNDESIDIRITKAWAYLHLADLKGHAINMSRDNENQPLLATERYRFDVADMVFIKDTKGTFSADHLKLLKLLTLKTPHIISHVSGIRPFLDDCVHVAHAVSE